MSDLNRYQAEAVDSVARSVRDDGARVLSLEMASGFGRLQTLAHIACVSFQERRTVFAVAHPSHIEQALAMLAEKSAGRRVGLLNSGAEIQVGTIKRTLWMVREGHASPDLIVIDGTGAEQRRDVEDIRFICAHSTIVIHSEPERRADAPVDPDTFSFPVRILERRQPEAAPGQAARAGLQRIR